MDTIQPEIQRLEAKLTEIESESDQVNANVELLQGEIERSISQDAMGTVPYPDKNHERDRAKLISFEAKKIKLETARKAIADSIARLKIKAGREALVQGVKKIEAINSDVRSVHKTFVKRHGECVKDIKFFSESLSKIHDLVQSEIYPAFMEANPGFEMPQGCSTDVESLRYILDQYPDLPGFGQYPIKIRELREWLSSHDFRQPLPENAFLNP